MKNAKSLGFCFKQGKEKNGRPMLSCKCHGIFINPVLEPSVKELSYVYTWRDGMPLTQQMQPITLRNVAELPLDFVLRTQLPFSIDTYEFKLMPNETTTVNVSFDPALNDTTPEALVVPTNFILLPEVLPFSSV